MNCNSLLRPVVAAVALGGLVLAPVGAADGRPIGQEAELASAPNFELPAVQVRIATDRALAEHAFLVIEAMRTSADAAGEFDAAVEALEANTTDIETLIGGVVSPDEAEQFGQRWRDHIAYLVDYARAVEEELSRCE